MRMKFLAVSLLLLAGCGSPIPSPAPSPAPSAANPPTASPAAIELPPPGTELAPGRYTKSDRPQVTFDLGPGWSVGQVERGFFDIERDLGSPDSIAFQFANVTARGGVDSAESIADDIAASDDIVVIERTGVMLGHLGDRLSGVRLTVETSDPTDSEPPIFRPVFDARPGFSIASGRRLQINLFSIHMGVFAVMVGGSIAQWDHTLEVCEPILDSLTLANYGL